MCGIAGIFAYQSSAPAVRQGELLRIRDHMVARGPDGEGMWVSEDRRIGLAHRRLAIIDLSTEGAQPMATPDGRYQIVFNGEIYNYRELRAVLERQGVQFRGHSDTEVLLQMYRQHGYGMCKSLRGMYAFAIWDEIEKNLFLARDPFGIKPLYIAHDGNTLRFASQVKALLAGGAVSKSVDPVAEAGYWIWGHVPEPHTLFSAIRALSPGTWLQVKASGQMQDGQFDSVADMLIGQASPPRVYRELRQALLDSVRHHLVADVPVGLFLSAGIDSASLAGLASESGGTLQTVTLGFEEYRGTSQDEAPLAEAVAKHYGTRHQTVWIGRKDFSDAYQHFIHAMDQPTIDGLNTWLVARAAHQVGLKVALSGLGGDEFFGGYPSFKQLPRMQQLARPFAHIPGLGRMIRQLIAPAFMRYGSPKMASLLEYGSGWNGSYMLRRAIRMPWERVDTAKCDAELATPPLTHSHAMVSYLESTRYMRNQLLRDCDWASMAHSIELRVPLVDTYLTRFIAYERHQGRIYSKQDLAATVQPPLPSAVTLRPKTGFTVPVRDWLLEGNMHYANSGAAERGLRGWQVHVAKAYPEAPA